MKTNQFIFAALTAAFLSVANYAAAQVTIGGGGQPAAGAVLDLNSTTKGGLVLSNVTIPDLEKIPAGQLVGIASEEDVNTDLIGTIVYGNSSGTFKQEVSEQNTIDMGVKGIFVWDGNKWNPISSTPAHSITFAPYNLGADPTQFNSGEYASLSPAKRQIRYLKDCTLANAVNVYGDLYQWGRVADGHEKRDAEPYATAGMLENADLDGNGQVINDYGAAVYNKTDTDKKYGHFIRNSNDWHGGTIVDGDSLWGNGEGYGKQNDNQGGVLYTNGKYYQNTDWAIPANNPCVSMGAGWRVPTQDEWERLCNYNSDPGSASGGVPTIAEGDMPATGQATTSTGSAPLTWVPVAGGIPSTDWVIDTEQKLGGYAVYKTADWKAAIAMGGYFDPNSVGSPNFNTYTLYAAAAPEPLLFLPAAGTRNPGTGVLGGSEGNYWSSTRYNTTNYSTFLRLQKTQVVPNVNTSRSSGYSVRCAKSL
ncbi:MAG: fibrobacter succinogenes major paralogous domain-containing protein [Prevotellaceae bacterium]|nr:fibrobacter succinogenes major paralogous domain-containing protein [Prevotellaceae bacterium]